MLHFNTGESPAIEVDKAAGRRQQCSEHCQEDHKTHGTKGPGMKEDKSREDLTATLRRLAEERSRESGTQIVVQITLGNDIDPAIEPLGLRMYRTSRFLQKMECGKVENAVNRIEAQSIYAKFPHPIERIFNKEPPDFVAVRSIKIDG
jgi:hypothetical protein